MKKTFAKYKIIIIIIWVVLLLIGSGYLIYQEKFSSQPYNEKSIYFHYPKNWQIYGENTLDVSKHLPGTNTVTLIKDNRQSTNFGVDIKDVEGDKLNITESIQAIDEKNKKFLDDFEKITSYETTILDVPAIDYSFNYSLKTAGPTGVIGKWDGRQRQIIFIKNNKLYTLIFTADPNDFDKDIKDFEKILKTFQIK